MTRFRSASEGRARRLGILTLVGGVVAGAAIVPAAAGAIVNEADLSVAISHPAGAYVTGDTVTFTATATNAGPDVASDVVIGLSLGYPLRFESGSASCEVVQYDQTSVLCDVGSVASGASATVEVAVEAYAAGVYVVPAVASSSTPDPDSADLSATDTVLVRRGALQGERYVRGEFPGVFGRTPDPATVAFWNARFMAARDRYPSRIADVPSGWINSGEYRRLRIREAYTRILGRSAGSADLTTWGNQLAKGMTFEQLDRQLLLSLEFRNARPAAGAFAAGVYQAVLGRAPSSSEAGAAQQQLAGGRDLEGFVRRLQRSTEAYDVLIGQRFQSAVGHAPDAFARYVWQTRLRNGYTVEKLYALLLVSSEVMADYPRTFDDYPTYEEYDRIDQDSGLPVYDFRD